MMGKFVWEGWQTNTPNAARPTGPIVLRDGRRVPALDLPEYLDEFEAKLKKSKNWVDALFKRRLGIES
jgi:hypothetical protein